MAKIASMASSSRRRAASTTKKSNAGKTRTISVGRKDTLPRKGNPSAGRHKPVVQPTFDAPMESPGGAVTSPDEMAPRARQTKTVAVRTKTIRGAGRVSRKPKLAAIEVMRAAMVPDTPAPVAPTVDEQSAMTTPEAPGIEMLAAVHAEIEVDASAIVEEATILDETRVQDLAGASADGVPIAASALHHGRRALTRAVARLLFVLGRWTGVRP